MFDLTTSHTLQGTIIAAGDVCANLQNILVQWDDGPQHEYTVTEQSAYILTNCMRGGAGTTDPFKEGRARSAHGDGYAGTGQDGLKPGSMIASVRMPMSSSSHTSAANDRVVSSWRRSTSENGA
ncbi:hypothetical protein B0H15DRAFT_1019786 [Mycena belliarum]|uniref:Uncharacterized protein n=1 Tax=Mycena belliarum TaxID=1033014 RepID=A0AAD6UBY2_9AGAR|nr:hypothetical protein B0H15DRAFT_1019786 [Mycena belliae]